LNPGSIAKIYTTEVNDEEACSLPVSIPPWRHRQCWLPVLGSAKQNPDCQVSKCKSSLVYSSHNAYYRKWNRLTYILRHEHMYTTFHRNYVYSLLSSSENHTFVSPQKSVSLFQKMILVSDCHRMHAKKLPKLERWYTPKTICIVDTIQSCQ
jgi:hypothetical protein